MIYYGLFEDYRKSLNTTWIAVELTVKCGRGFKVEDALIIRRAFNYLGRLSRPRPLETVETATKQIEKLPGPDHLR